MKIPNTDLTLEELLAKLPITIHYVDNEGFLRYHNKIAASPAGSMRKIGVNIKDCHAHPESLVEIERIYQDFRNGRKEPHYYVNLAGEKVTKVPIFNAEGKLLGILSFSHPAGPPPVERTF
jgi:DUF438 domain-containing protein